MQNQSSAEDSARRWGLAIFVLAVLPVLGAIWGIPWFVTQDGPSHLYNTHILGELLKRSSPFHSVYEIRWTPFPNWGGSLVLLGLVETLPPRVADRMMMSLSCVGLAGAVVWLRWQVTGWRGMPIGAALAVMMALNVLWLLGFSSFLLGAWLFPITLGFWWSRQEQPGPGLAVTLASLLILNYFFHLVSFGLTALGLIILALATPGSGWRARFGWTIAGLSPLIPLGLLYRKLTRDSGGLRSEWWVLSNPCSLRSWLTQVSWADPITLAGKARAPFVPLERFWFHLLAPIVWLGLALGVILIAGLVRYRCRERVRPVACSRRGWFLLACVLLVGGVMAPDQVGPGAYLPQRITLLGLVALIPFLQLELAGWPSRTAGAALGLALVLQIAFVWDYALLSNRLVADYVQAKPIVGNNKRIGPLIAQCRLLTSHRANPLVHIGSMLGVANGNILWDNYEPLLPHFPLRFRDEAARQLTRSYVPLACYDGRNSDLANNLTAWQILLEHHHDQIDMLVVRGYRPELSATLDAWFQPVFEHGNVRVLEHRQAGPARLR